ncbi:transmembrane gamma-carboxyglutamic acid protein 1 [Notothenia coriiceps]|uniref:Transmembrane gamma-carboxyglutamic acid protein 1 n=1 Tax=Notothenia coriiceps TaxID=8208 RepID=A0A6I9Q444_9TELE|nr:PREDICTED: transmembrane gamma-carboxyglutamic acid protein 1-like [Notothenia coriiceps]
MDEAQSCARFLFRMLLSTAFVSQRSRKKAFKLSDPLFGKRRCATMFLPFIISKEMFLSCISFCLSSVWFQRRFWEEYVRESSPSGGLETVGGVHSLYLIVPLLLVVLIIVAVAITVWRCHSRKRSQPSPSQGHSHHDHVLSVVSMDHWGRDFHQGDHSELSVHSSPAYPGSEPTSGRGGTGDPPPSYDEAVGHTDVQIETEPPPQYEDIVNTSSGGRVK